MYSFLVLLPLTLISAAVGGVIVFSPQVAEYVAYITTFEALHRGGGRLPLQVAAHIAAYAIASFVLVVTARTISAPLSPDRGFVLCRLQAALEAIFVAVPSVVIVALATYSLVGGPQAAAAANQVVATASGFGPPEALFWTAAAAGVVCLLTIVFAGRPREHRRFQLALVAIVAGIPTALFLVLFMRQLASGEPTGGLLALAAAVGATGLVANVAAIVLVKRPLDLFRSSLSPFSITLVDLLVGLAFATSVALVISFMLRPVDSATFLGIFPVFFMASTTFLIVVARVFARGSSPVAIVSAAISVMVVMHALDGLMPTREFRYRSETAGLQPKPGAKLGIREVEKARGIVDLRDAFLAWLQARRPAIEAYRKKGKAYPVFVVAAQGGGIYAAYHSSLSLARLYDSCPEFANHVFALSGVSGGALGSAVFSELLQSVPEGLSSKPGNVAEGCNPRPGAPNLEKGVKAFFTADFLSPVVDSALVFDIPSLVVPWLRFGLDRAYALEFAFENAWGKAGRENAIAGDKVRHGLQANFYGRWRPDGPAPALFLGTTGVNYGVPVMVSQIRWSQNPRLGLGRRRGQEGPGREEWADLLKGLQAQNERGGSSVIANILDFRPDLQLATSTAVALSARFPYVTPPANIRRNEDIEHPRGLFDKITVLELLDGAYFDNSGGWVAIDILEDLERYLRGGRRGPGFQEFTDDIKFHLVRFTDRPAQRYGTASEDEHFELVTPLIAFNTVRAARGAQLRGASELEKTSETFLYLSDPWFQPSLNWLLTQDTKAKIELRSGGPAGTENEVCCRVTAPPPKWLSARKARERQASPREMLLLARWEDAKKLSDNPELKDWQVEKFVPNNGASFAKLLTLIKEGDARDAAATAAAPN